MENKYSEWLKIDLHIHTILSKTTKDNDYKGNFSITVTKNKLIANDVKIFSFTDHNVINVNAYEEYYNSYTECDPLLLLGVELDIEVKNNTNTKKYHTLIIFNYLSIESVKNVSQRLENKYIEKGISNPHDRVLTIDEIVEIFPKDNYFFIPHADSDKDIVSAYKGPQIKDAQKMVLLMQCALEKVTKQETIRAYEIGFNSLLSQSFKSKKDIPYINFSDNHNIEQYPCKHKGENEIGDHEFYLIKGSKCFESIRLAFIDPESRIKSITEFQNSINQTNNTINKLVIKDNPIISDVELEFSPHLNVIIGGRSSGKSLLMWILGNKIDSLSINDKYKKINLDTIKIQAKNDSNFVEKTTLQQNLIYLGQNDIIRYFEEGILKDLAKKSNKENEYNYAVNEFNKHKLKIEELLTSFIYSYKSVFELGVSKQILHNNTILKILSTHYILKVDSNALGKEFDKTKKVEESDLLLKNISENIIKLADLEILNFTETERQAILNFKTIINKKINHIKKESILNLKRTSFLKNVYEIIKNKNASLNAEAKQKEEAFENLEKLKKAIKDRFEKLRLLKKHSLAFELIEGSFRQTLPIDNGILLVLETSKIHDIKKNIFEGINNPEAKYSLFINALRLLSKKSTIKNLGENKSENLNKKIKSQLEDFFLDLTKPKDYLLYADGETSKEKSPGFNSEKYLEIILKNPITKTVFIDQPEDNLGNNFIANNLVNIIRVMKLEKQIFLVTHNPSIVVYGDAESIIFAKNDNNIIKYKQIVLENTAAQKEICGILDGGEYIFNNRSLKYNIKRLMNL